MNVCFPRGQTISLTEVITVMIVGYFIKMYLEISNGQGVFRWRTLAFMKISDNSLRLFAKMLLKRARGIKEGCLKMH